MKHLIMLLIIPTAIFSQSIDTLQPLRQIDVTKWDQLVTSTSIGSMTLQTGSVKWRMPVSKPDTLRAIVLVTMGYRHQGMAHARMGFVVIAPGKRPVYLDCRKRALKPPQVGWGYEIVEPNYKK